MPRVRGHFQVRAGQEVTYEFFRDELLPAAQPGIKETRPLHFEFRGVNDPDYLYSFVFEERDGITKVEWSSTYEGGYPEFGYRAGVMVGLVVSAFRLGKLFRDLGHQVETRDK